MADSSYRTVPATDARLRRAESQTMQLRYTAANGMRRRWRRWRRCRRWRRWRFWRRRRRFRRWRGRRRRGNVLEDRDKSRVVAFCIFEHWKRAALAGLRARDRDRAPASKLCSGVGLGLNRDHGPALDVVARAFHLGAVELRTDHAAVSDDLHLDRRRMGDRKLGLADGTCASELRSDDAVAVHTHSAGRATRSAATPAVEDVQLVRSRAQVRRCAVSVQATIGPASRAAVEEVDTTAPVRPHRQRDGTEGGLDRERRNGVDHAGPRWSGARRRPAAERLRPAEKGHSAGGSRGQPDRCRPGREYERAIRPAILDESPRRGHLDRGSVAGDDEVERRRSGVARRGLRCCRTDGNNRDEGCDEPPAAHDQVPQL
jgi:hypothetical protein